MTQRSSKLEKSASRCYGHTMITPSGPGHKGFARSCQKRRSNCCSIASRSFRSGERSINRFSPTRSPSSTRAACPPRTCSQPLSRPRGRDLSAALQRRPSVVLFSTDATRRGGCLQGVRLTGRRPSAIYAAHLLHRPNDSSKRTAASEHRGANVRFLCADRTLIARWRVCVSQQRGVTRSSENGHAGSLQGDGVLPKPVQHRIRAPRFGQKEQSRTGNYERLPRSPNCELILARALQST